MKKFRFDVTPEILAFHGPGAVPRQNLPALSVALIFNLAGLVISCDPDLSQASDQGELMFFITAEACQRAFGISSVEAGRWHLPTDLRAIALAVLDVRIDAAVRHTFRLAKSLELLCATFQKMRDGDLVISDRFAIFSEQEFLRILQVRRLIDERWGEKLSLNSIARECGLNRAKLTRSFRSMFACSVADAIVERRMEGARELLLATDLPVSSIGYRCGYVSNASFTRAFSRRFGLAPTRLRADRIAA